jgi:hypothetical protein
MIVISSIGSFSHRKCSGQKTKHDPGHIRAIIIQSVNSMCDIKREDFQQQSKLHPGTIVGAKDLIVHPYYNNDEMRAKHDFPADFCLAKVEIMTFSTFIKPMKIATQKLSQKQKCFVLKF